MGDGVRLRMGDRELTIEVWPFRVGRAEHCELVVDDARLARVQLSIDRAIGSAGSWTIAALGVAPVRVNGIQVGGELRLRAGDRIESGGFQAVFLAPFAPTPPPVRASATPTPVVSTSASPPITGSPAAAPAAGPRTRRFITTGGVSRATRPPRAPLGLAVSMAVLVAAATALFAAAFREMSSGDGTADPRYASRPIEIAPRPTRDPERPARAATAPPAHAYRPDSEEAPDEAVYTPIAVAPRSTGLPTPEGEPVRTLNLERHDGLPESPDPSPPDLSPPGSGGPGGSVTPAEDPPPDSGETGEVRIPILGEEVRGKKVAFVIDRSGSMAPVWIAVRNELVATLRLLTPDHRFSIVLYSNELQVFLEGWTPGTPEMIERAIAWTQSVPARGATDPEPAVEHALRLPGIEALVLMSDIRFKGARMDRTVDLLTRATRGTKTYKAIKLYFFPLEQNESTARITALSSGSASAALRLGGLRR